MPLGARHQPTHSHKKFTWEDLLSEAYGEFGLHPWDFDQYTMQEYILKRKGLATKELGEWHRARFIAYYAASGNLKKGTKLTDILPLPGERKEKKLKDMKGDELKDWYEKRKELEIKAGLRNG